MKIRLLDYAGTEKFCEIPDDTEEIAIDIISGDMAKTSPVYFDSSRNRIMNFYDGSVVLTRDQFYYLEAVKDSYELFYIV